jgi:creatinine amidohydrolase
MSSQNGHSAERKTKSLGFPSFCLGNLSYVDIQEYLKHSDTILIPKASLEQHGPHLPLYCDTITATEVAQRAGEAAGILYTPTIWLGYSPARIPIST